MVSGCQLYRKELFLLFAELVQRELSHLVAQDDCGEEEGEVPILHLKQEPQRTKDLITQH